MGSEEILKVIIEPIASPPQPDPPQSARVVGVQWGGGGESTSVKRDPPPIVLPASSFPSPTRLNQCHADDSHAAYLSVNLGNKYEKKIGKSLPLLS